MRRAPLQKSWRAIFVRNNTDVSIVINLQVNLYTDRCVIAALLSGNFSLCISKGKAVSTGPQQRGMLEK